MASLQNKKGYWYLVWSDSSRLRKKQVWESLKTKDRQRAQKLKSRLETEYYDGKHNPWEKPWYARSGSVIAGVSLSEAIEEYVRCKAGQRGRRGWKTERTQKTHEGKIRTFARSVGEDRPIETITSTEFQRYLDNADISDHTRTSYYTILKIFFSWCCDRGYIDTPPTAEVDQPGEKVPNYIYPKDLVAITDYHTERIEVVRHQNGNPASVDWMADAWWILARTGLRPGELRRLKTGDVRENELLIGSWYRTKTNQQRYVPIFDEIRPILNKYLDPEYRVSCPQLDSNDLLLGRASEQSYRRLSEELTECAEQKAPHLGHIHAYDLRHTFAVWYLTQPADTPMDFRLTRLMYILGHKSIETTQGYLRAVAGMVG